MASSIAEATSAGTPRLERVSQYQTCDCVVPIRSAKGFCPPAMSHARLSASADMRPSYPDLGKSQPRTLLGTRNLSFSNFPTMGKVVNEPLGRRARKRRLALGHSQAVVAEKSGISQQNIGSIEKGLVGRPGRIFELAEALHTTADWLLHERGPEVVLRADPHKELAEIAKNIPADRLDPVIRLLKTLAADLKGDVA